VTGASLVVRPIDATAELRACEELQVAVWGYSDREVVPKNELLAAVRSGGSLLGAFDGGELLGFAYAMPGFDGKRPYLSSRLLAVREGSRSRGLGERLKRAQREHALAAGYDVIRWTQDPLQAANARLNFRKLGAISRRYVEDYYGSTSSPLHGSLPTDRLEIEWHLSQERVARRLGEAPGVDPLSVPDAPPAASVLDGVADPSAPDAPPRPGPALEPPPDARHLTLAIPTSLAKCLERDRALGLAWRLATRSAFEKAFARGFSVVDFLVSANVRRDEVSSEVEVSGGIPAEKRPDDALILPRYYLAKLPP
jgi:predicted GNAT superfamily acetyltransferase